MVRLSIREEALRNWQMRDAQEIVSLAEKFRSRLMIARGASLVNARSLLGLVSLARLEGEPVIEAEGEDEEEAAWALWRLIEDPQESA